MEMENLKAIIIDDDPGDIELLTRLLDQLDPWNIEVVAVSECDDWTAALTNAEADIVFLDYVLGPLTGLDLLESVADADRCCPVILLTGSGDERIAVGAMHLGAADYLAKSDLSLTVVERAILNALQKHALRRQLEEHRRQLEKKVVELQEALAHVRRLQGLLPICSFCKKIRDDNDSWNQLEKYISEHSDAEFSHSICDECAKEHYPEFSRPS